MSHFSWTIDGSIIGLYLLGTMWAGIWVRKYVGKVEHFLVAGREMNLYLGIASLAATEFGIITCMYTAQLGYESGFAGVAPGICQFLAMLVVGLTGFCVKPLRDSGVYTIPELFEQRYGKLVRWLSGVVIVLGGLLNMGVFLRVGGEFLLLVTGVKLDPTSHSLEIMMTVMLVFVAVYTILGGMLSVLITDFLQFIIMSAGLIIVTILVLKDVGWSQMVHAVDTKIGPAGFNPFIYVAGKPGMAPKMGWPFIVFNILMNLAAVLTWQTVIQRLLAAKDTRTGRRIYTRTSFFFVCRFLIPGLWGIAALATLAPGVVGANTGHAMPIFLSQHLPVGVMGILIAAMLAADMSTDSSYMLTWGSIIYNDIMQPVRWLFRMPPFTERRGLAWNRLIIAAIGVFLLFYGLWYDISDKPIWSYLMVTGTIYMASMMTLLIACCYWKRANNWGAIASIVFSFVIPMAYLIAERGLIPVAGAREWALKIGPNYAGITAYACSGLAMIVGSLLKPQSKSN